MNAVLEEILREGRSVLPDGDTVEIDSAIPRGEGEFLQEIVGELRPRVSVEIGLAHGISTLFLAEALERAGTERHIVIDPHQLSENEWGGSWRGAGLHNLERAGLRRLIDFRAESSHRVLASLEAEQTAIDFAFVDGWHLFDWTLVEFFYLDRMLRTGGAIAFDDADWPAIRKVCRFVVTNRAYTVWRTYPATPVKATRRRGLVLRDLLKGRGPVSEEDEIDQQFGLHGRCIVLRKHGGDTRRWDSHVPF
jgi:predicted O-methyltransferase YrrM